MIPENHPPKPRSHIVVVGCYAQLRAREIMDIEGVHLVLNARDKFNVAHYFKPPRRTGTARTTFLGYFRG